MARMIAVCPETTWLLCRYIHAKSKRLLCITSKVRVSFNGRMGEALPMLYYTVLRSRSVLDQLAEGLSVLGVLDAVRCYPKLMEPLFIGGKQKPLTAGKDTNVMHAKF